MLPPGLSGAVNSSRPAMKLSFDRFDVLAINEPTSTRAPWPNSTPFGLSNITVPFAPIVPRMREA